MRSILSIKILALIIVSVIVCNTFADRVVKGKIVDAENNEAINGVNILPEMDNSKESNLEWRSTSGTSSNNSGEFTISISSKVEYIILSHVSYETKRISIDKLNSKDVIIKMLPLITQTDNVIVSASLREESLMKCPKSVDVISQKKICEEMNSNLIDVLESKPGFTQVWEYHSPILLRGLNSKRIVIMKNNCRRIGTFPGGYFGQDMNVFGGSKIEIVKGPGSVIYGSGAISGIINMLDKPLYGKRADHIKILSGFGSNNNEFLEVASINFRRKKYGIALNTKYRTTDDYIFGNEEEADNSNVEDKDLSIKSSYLIDDNLSLSINADYHEGDWGKPRGFNGSHLTFTKIRNNEDAFHTSLVMDYKTKNMIRNINLTLYYDNGSRDYYKYKHSTVSGAVSSLELVHYKNNYFGGQIYGNIMLVDNNQILVGMDGFIFNLDNSTDVYDYYYDTEGKIDGYDDAGQQVLGFFVNDDWQFNESFTIKSGIRFDVAEVNEGENVESDRRSEKRSAVSGNIGSVYNLNDQNVLSLNIGRAFRMPSSEEMFTEIISCKGTKKGNPDLEPEYSFNLDLGLKGASFGKRLRYDVALFYNDIIDYINESSDSEHEDIDFTYKNGDARIIGGEFTSSYRFEDCFREMNTLYLGIGGSYVYGLDLTNNDEPLFGVPPMKLRGEVKYQGMVDNRYINKYSLKFVAHFAADQNRIPELPEGIDGGPWGYEKSEQNIHFDLSLMLKSFKIIGMPTLKINIKNIFNQEFYPYGSHIPAMGRNIKAVLIFNFWDLWK